MTPRKKYSCKFPGCDNSYYVKVDGGINKQFYKFPKNHDLCMKWKMICGIDISVNCQNMRVCENHFQPVDFVNFTKHLLNPNVVPTKIKKPNNLISVQISPPLSTDKTDQNYCRPVELNDANTSTVYTDSFNNDVNANTVCEENPAHPCDTNTFDNITVNKDANYSVDNSNDEKECEETVICICDKEICKNEKSYFVNKENNYPGKTCSNSIIENCVQNENLRPKTRVSSETESERYKHMYEIKRRISVKLSKMKRKMTDTKNALADLKKKYDTNVFDCINAKLNDVTKAFIKSQLVNASRSNSGKRWTEQDKAFALSMYKRGPRLYKFLRQYFELPSPRSLQRILSKIPFETGINKTLLEQLKVKIDEIDEQNRYASLIFDEMSLSKGFHYEAHKQIVNGYKNLGESGRTANAADHALVFMIRGIRKSWKQVIAYYFTTDQIFCNNLKFLLKYIMEQLQDIGIKIKATVCDQGSTQRKALSELSKENNIKRTSYTFMVRLKKIVVIFDVPHLLKNTRNALISRL